MGTKNSELEIKYIIDALGEALNVLSQLEEDCRNETYNAVLGDINDIKGHVMSAQMDLEQI